MKTSILALAATLMLSGLTACTADSSALPDIAAYGKDSDLMINICDKFVHDEGDGKRLHDAAVGVQQTRVVSCSDYNNECTLYGECLNLVIQSSASGFIQAKDRIKMNDKLAELKTAVAQGRVKLRSEWEKRSASGQK